MSDTAPPPAAFLFQQASVRKVVLETLHVHDYPLLRGTVLVANLAFEKRVLVRLTYDSWLSYVDVPCEFTEAVSDSELTCSPEPGSVGNPTSLRLDRFTFSYLIPPAYFDLRDLTVRHARSPIQLALCYHIWDQEIWDNNHGPNYCFRLSRALIDLGVKGSSPVMNKCKSDTEVEMHARLRSSLKKMTIAPFSSPLITQAPSSFLRRFDPEQLSHGQETQSITHRVSEDLLALSMPSCSAEPSRRRVLLMSKAVTAQNLKGQHSSWDISQSESGSVIMYGPSSITVGK